MLRIALLVGHLMAFAVALSAVLRGDALILRAARLHSAPLRQISRQVAWALLLLVVTGFGLVALDTGFVPARMAANPKLLVKLSVIAVLMLNALALHRWAFPALMSRQSGSRWAPGWVCVAGAVSTTSWLFATFVGVARPLTSELGYVGFMSLYGVCLVVAIAVAWVWVRPRISRLMHQRAAASALLSSTDWRLAA